MASKMEQFLVIPDFSKLWLMHPGSPPAILIRRLFFCGGAWDVRVLPHDFIKGVPSSIRVSVSLRPGPGGERSASGINVSLEILDNTWEQTVFHVENEIDGYVFLIVKRIELEVTSCVHNDNIPVRCTLTSIDMKKKKTPKKAAAAGSKWWRLLRRSLYLAPLKTNNNSNLEEASIDVIPDRPAAATRHLITVSGYSKLAQMPAASSLTLRRFRFLGHRWTITLFPNGSNETSADSISIMAERHSGPESADSRIAIAIEILDRSQQHALFTKKQMLGKGTIMVNNTELEAASCLNEDSFSITCTLTFLDTKQQQQQDKEKMGTIPRTTDEPDSVCTPLLSHEKLLNF